MRLKAGIVALLFAMFITSCSGCIHGRASIIQEAKPTKTQLFTKLHESMVNIAVLQPGAPSPMFRGSGEVVYSSLKGSIVLTAWHVVDEVLEPGAKGMIVIVYRDQDTHKTMMFPALVVKSDPKVDLALIAVPKMIREPIKLAAIEPNRYDELYVMGSPEGYDGAVASAILFNKHIFFNEFMMEKGVAVQFKKEVWGLSNTSVIFGVSGGAVVNDRGELVGNANSTVVEPYMTELDLAPGNKDIKPMPVVIDLPFTQMGFCVPLHIIREFVNSYQP